MSEYLATIVLYLFVYVIGGWGLNLQFGTAGVLSFCFVIFQAAGAYTVAIFSLGSAKANGGMQSYFFGARLPFPVPLLLAMIVGAALAAVVGTAALRRVRNDYQGMVLFVVGIAAVELVIAMPGFLNGPSGLSLIPTPFSTGGVAINVGQTWEYVAVAGLLCLFAWVVMRALTEGPYGRAVRAVRDNERGAEALAMNPFRLRLSAFVVGGAFGALSGGILAYYLTSWSPSAWNYPETFWFFTSVIVGGTGNLGGVAVGSMIVVAVQQGLYYLPAIGSSDAGAALQVILAALVTIIFLWFRPQGIFPERRHRLYGVDASAVELLGSSQKLIIVSDGVAQ